MLISSIYYLYELFYSPNLWHTSGLHLSNGTFQRYITNVSLNLSIEEDYSLLAEFGSDYTRSYLELGISLIAVFYK